MSAELLVDCLECGAFRDSYHKSGCSRGLSREGKRSKSKRSCTMVDVNRAYQRPCGRASRRVCAGTASDWCCDRCFEDVIANGKSRDEAEKLFPLVSQ